MQRFEIHPPMLIFIGFVVAACQIINPWDGSDGFDLRVEPGSVLFQDDYSDPASGWERVRDREGVSDYENGAYFFRIDHANWYIWSTPGLNFGDVRIEVDAQPRPGGPINMFGVICRFQDMDNFYFFNLTSDGYYGVVKFLGGTETLIGMPELQWSRAINQDGARNHIQVECIGSTLSLAVNGIMLASVVDQDFESGDVGLIAGTFDEAGIEVHFDNFAVLAPER